MTAVQLDAIVDTGAIENGVHWSVEGSDDLNVNLAHLGPGSTVAPHVHAEVDVVVVVTSGSGWMRIDGTLHDLTRHVLALAVKGSKRSILAGPEGLTYVTAHRRREPLGIRTRRDGPV